MDFYNQIEDFLNGSLSETQKASFEQAMLEDETLRATVDNFPTLQGILEREAREEARKSIKAAAQNVGPVHARTARLGRAQILRVAAIGLVVVIAGAAIIANTMYSTSGIISSYHVMPDDLSVNQSDDNTQLPYAAVVSMWESGSRTQAIELGAAYLATSPGDTDFKYRLAHMYFEMDDFSNSGRLFDELSGDPRYADEADFLAAMCDLKSSDPVEGKVELERISNNPEHAMSEVSGEVLKKLRSPIRLLSFN